MTGCTRSWHRDSPHLMSAWAGPGAGGELELVPKGSSGHSSRRGGEMASQAGDSATQTADDSCGLGREIS